MIKDFKQVIFSDTLNLFKKEFMSRWELVESSDHLAPTIFFGLYTRKDIARLTQHKGPKIVIWGGNDMQPSTLRYVSNLQKEQHIYVWAYPGEFSDTLVSYNITHKQLYVALKDYSKFEPSILGESVYVYKGIYGDRANYYNWNEIIKPLTQTFGEGKIIYSNNLSINSLIKDVYSKCFVYIKPNPKGGCTTMFELGHMGIKTVGKSHKNLDFFSEYDSMSHLIELILEESKYVGKVRKDIAESTKSIFTGEEWLTLNFWLNE